MENRTGASGNIGTEAVAKAKPDGYTFLVGSPGTMAINPHLFKSLPYDARTDFIPITTWVSFPQVLIVNRDLPVKSLEELIAYVKARPGKLNHASSGSGSTSHLVMELIKAAAGLEITHVPFRGGSPATQAVIAGDVQMGVEGLPSLPAHLKAGTIRAIAVTSAQRTPTLPDVPAISEIHQGLRRGRVGDPVRACGNACADRRAHGAGVGARARRRGRALKLGGDRREHRREHPRPDRRVPQARAGEVRPRGADLRRARGVRPRPCLLRR